MMELKTMERYIDRVYAYAVKRTFSEEEAAAEELYSFLRQKIAMLPAMYRDIIILHYYDNLSAKAISMMHYPKIFYITVRKRQSPLKPQKENIRPILLSGPTTTADTVRKMLREQ